MVNRDFGYSGISSESPSHSPSLLHSLPLSLQIATSPGHHQIGKRWGLFWMRWKEPLKSYCYWTWRLFYIDIAILPLETRPYIFQLRAKILKILGLRIGPISDALLREAAKWHCQCQNTANVNRCSGIMFANVRPHKSKAHLFSIH